MTCRDFQSRLSTAIETRAAAEIVRLAAHGEVCAEVACQAAWADHQLLARAVAEWRLSQPVAPSRVADRVLAEIAAESIATHRAQPLLAARPAPRNSGMQWSSVGISAALLLAIGLFLRPAGESRFLAVRVRPPAARTLDATPEAVVSHQAPIAPTPVEPRPESYVELAHEATYFVTDLAMLVVPVDVDAADETSTPAWFTRIGERLEPVKTGVEGKLGEWFNPPAT